MTSHVGPLVHQIFSHHGQPNFMVYQCLSSPFRSKVAILLHAVSPFLRQTYGFSKCSQIRRGHNEFTHCGQRARSAHGSGGSSADAGGTGGTGGGQRTGGVGKDNRW